MDTTYPFYVVDLGGYRLIASKGRRDVPHAKLWYDDVSKVFAKHHGLSYDDIKNLCYACYRGRVSTPTTIRRYSSRQLKILEKKGIKANDQVVFFGEKDDKVVEVIKRHFSDYRIEYDEHHKRQESDVARMATFLDRL